MAQFTVKDQQGLALAALEYMEFRVSDAKLLLAPLA
jgi:hypothetical protein